MGFEARVLLVLMGCVSCQHVLAAYPERPLRMIVPSAAGGQPDTNSRLVANELGRQLGQQVVVDNRPGASSTIGFEAMARAQPDGYTIGYGAFPLATNPSLLAKLPYDVNKDFRMIVLTNISPNVIAITPALPANSITELVAYAKRNPDQLMFGSTGSGSTMNLSMELLKQMTGTRMVNVPFKGMQQVITEIIGAPVTDFFFVVVEKQAPYGVAVFKLTDEAVATGQDESLADLRRLKVCRETDVWPNIEPEVTELGLPKWYGGAR